MVVPAFDGEALIGWERVGVKAHWSPIALLPMLDSLKTHEHRPRSVASSKVQPFKL